MKAITYSAQKNTLMRVGLITSWSALRRIGSLPLMRAVMFSPLIAYLIVFNDYVIGFFEQVSINMKISATDSLSVTNVYFLYYGLISVGAGSIIYGFFCPKSVARFSDSMDFASSVQSLHAHTFVLSYFDDILRKFTQSDERGHEAETIDYPDFTRLRTSAIVVEVYKKYLEGDRAGRFDNAEDGESDGLDEFHQEFITGSGYFNAEAIAERAYQAPKVIWAFSEPYRAVAAQEFAADIAFTKYEIDDHSQPKLRFLTAILYTLGFFLLLIPSISTFIKLTIALF
ncbi:hypothetical protein [Notoacmeibacter sp. MSK16QG-6]|uniref:hypothetical protein n=1 Tax=Notoacmeibacter sp. MSK16QG-6 TaxID=2957982 RepID=UPI00209FEBCE|nr:hypothetical protein [Notoacmeibacter sp. MSK16QG-6]MCP1201110.1 hypothetical protein [Notoacmeibacter sp. MSK16QG-6]